MIQLLFNALLNAAILAPPAVAFTLLFRILSFPNFAVGAIITVAAYVVFTLDVILDWPVAAALAASLPATALIYWLLDIIVFKPMRGRSEMTLLIASVALTFVLENLVRLFFGSTVRALEIPLKRPMHIGPVRMAPDDIYVLAAAATLIVSTHLLLRYSSLGKAMRAMSDNATLAEIRGLDTARITTLTCLLCGAILGASGAIASTKMVIEPMLGWQLIIPIFASAILGGIGSPIGAVLGALAIGLAEELTVLVLSSTYKTAVAFLVIALVLILRPQGILGQPEVRK